MSGGGWQVSGELQSGYPYSFGPFSRPFALVAILRLIQRSDVLTVRLERAALPDGEGGKAPLPGVTSWYPSRPPPEKT